MKFWKHSTQMIKMNCGCWGFASSSCPTCCRPIANRYLCSCWKKYFHGKWLLALNYGSWKYLVGSIRYSLVVLSTNHASLRFLWSKLDLSSNCDFAVLLVLFNKAALSSYNFPCANVITLCQVYWITSFSVILNYNYSPLTGEWNEESHW